MSKTLLIIFVKNLKLGKVKTRLAKSIGNEGAFEVYKQLVQLTENATKDVVAKKRIYFSDAIIDEEWGEDEKFIQKGVDLGEKMQNAFKKGFEDGFEKIILIGSDLPDISASIIHQGFDKLNNKEVVFGPAEDGGYYLVGMTNKHYSIFEKKSWSTESLLQVTLSELKRNKVEVVLLQTLNDVDTIEDLKKSSLSKDFLNQYT